MKEKFIKAKGYSGYSKSNNAVDAENYGRYPLTKAAEIVATNFNITKEQAKWLLSKIGTNEWHHTSNHYNRTNYYDTDTEYIIDEVFGFDNSVNTIQDVKNFVEKNFSQEQTKKQENEYYANFDYIIWSGTRNYPKADVQHLNNVYVIEKGSFYYVYDQKDGNLIVKKKIGSNGTKVEKLNKNVANLDFKKQAEQPTTPKPTTELPEGLVWAWDENLNQWIALKKEDTYSVTNQNANVTQQNQTNTGYNTNYATASMEKVLASMMEKELKRSEIEDENDYFNCIFASKLIYLSGIDLETREPKFKVSAKGYQFLKDYNLNEINK